MFYRFIVVSSVTAVKANHRNIQAKNKNYTESRVLVRKISCVEELWPLKKEPDH